MDHPYTSWPGVVHSVHLVKVGTSASVAPASFAIHIEMQSFPHDISLRAAASQPIDIFAYRDVRVVSKEADFDPRLCITNVKRPLLGLADDIINSNIAMSINKKVSGIQGQGKTTKLIVDTDKLHLETIMVPPGKRVLPHCASSTQRNILDTDDEFPDDINIETLRPRTLRSPIQPSPAEIEQRNLTHQRPFRSWCGIC